jgi:S1-C subfamily serine protease
MANKVITVLRYATGAISALVGAQKNITQFQFTAPVQPGNSGGPILNTWGSLIGVTFARIDDMYVLENSGTLPQNINYGIRLDVVRDLLIENNIKFREGRNFWFQPTQERVAQLAKETTILLNCFR